MSLVNCQIDTKGLSRQSPLNVGDRFMMTCDGEMTATLKPSAQFLFKDQNLKYSLYILEVPEANTNHFKLIVTSYRAGEFGGALEITDGELTVQTNELSWKIESVLNPQQKPEMVPSKGPFFVSYPLWLWLTVAAVGLAITSLVGYIVYRKRRRARLLKELEQFKTMLSPIGQFSKDIRKTVRELSRTSTHDAGSAHKLIEQLDRDFRLYLIRELMVPALQVSDRELVREIKKSHPRIYEAHMTDFRKVLSELTQAKTEKEKTKIKDGEDLSFLTRKLAESIYDMKRKSGR